MDPVTCIGAPHLEPHLQITSEKSLNRSPKISLVFKSGKGAAMDLSHRDQAIAASLVPTFILAPHAPEENGGPKLRSL